MITYYQNLVNANFFANLCEIFLSYIPKLSFTHFPRN
jgi:hypothetical protein